ncbi:MAG TPA: ROK family protein [Lacipirellulaceae bacterium]|jgi:glucokinase|nr:ROK family protein [Lacipirellulaceae bacterium]
MPTAKRSRQLPQAVIGLDLGGTKLAAALFDTAGQPLIRRGLPLKQREGHAVGELVVSQIRRLLQTAEQRKLSVCAVGVCVPGIVRPQSGRVWAPNIPGWDDYPLKAEIKAAVSNQAVKIAIESDRTASILGEAWQGAARDCRNAVLMAVGTGIGAGILIDGRVLRGAHGIAGAVGWMALDRPFRPEYVERGCFESHASGHGIANMAHEAVERRQQFSGRLQNASTITAQDVFAAYETGDESATDVLQNAIAFWGMASANLISLFNPERLIFGGGVFGPATRFLDAIATEARRWAQPVAFEQVTFAASQLDDEAALYGAVYLALRAAGQLK